jgi:hypothetical protein
MVEQCCMLVHHTQSAILRAHMDPTLDICKYRVVDLDDTTRRSQRARYGCQRETFPRSGWT